VVNVAQEALGELEDELTDTDDTIVDDRERPSTSKLLKKSVHVSLTSDNLLNNK
jgi:hypothetical protein